MPLLKLILCILVLKIQNKAKIKYLKIRKQNSGPSAIVAIFLNN